MPLVLDPTVGGASANTYCTLAEATTYHEAHPYAAVWTGAATDDARNRALATATRLLDANVDWYGDAVNSTQRLLWPRINVRGRNGYVVESTVLPRELKDATAELARQLLAADRTADFGPETKGLKSLRTGSVELEFDNPQAKVLPDAVFYMVRHLGTLAQRGAGAVQVARA